MKKEILFALGAAIFLAVFVSQFASPMPDGLEKVAEDKGFIEKACAKPVLPAPVPDYVFPWVRNERIAGSIAGAFGTIVVFLSFFVVFGKKR